MADVFSIYNPWNFVHSDEFTTDIIIEEVHEIYSTGPPEAEGQQRIQEDTVTVQYHSYSKKDDDEDDESDIHEVKFLLRFLATNTEEVNRYLWVTDDGEVRSDGGYTNIATFFEVIHWVSPSQSSFQLICQGGLCKGYILYMEGPCLQTRKSCPQTDEKDITTKFQMNSRGDDISIRALISKTGVPIYFDDEGNFRPEGPLSPRNKVEMDASSKLQPLYFIVANVKTLHVTSV